MRLLYVTLSVLLGLHGLVQAVEFFDLAACENEKLCEKRPHGGPDYNTLLSIKPLDDDQVEFEVWAPRKTSDGEHVDYLAVGFSDDTQMGNEGVTFCFSLESGENGVGVGKTAGKTFAATSGFDNSVEAKEIRIDDKNFYCKFTQKVNKDSNDLLRPDLSKKYHILVVRGSASDKSNLHIHKFGPTDGPLVTDKVVLFVPPEPKPTVTESPSDASPPGEAPIETTPSSSHKLPTFSNDGGSAESKSFFEPTTQMTLKKIHGALMLLAWFGLVFSAVYSARHLRQHWPNTTVQGLQIWFHIHRLLNFLGVILIVVSIILIFLANDLKWSGPSAAATSAENTTSGAIHSLLGVIAVILAIFQPFMALLRCDKNHPRRVIFNFAHRSAGLLAIILAVITLGYAVFSFEHLWKNYTLAKIIFIIFLIFVVAVVVLQEFMRIRESKDHQVTAIEMHNRNSASTDSYYYKNQTVQSARYRHFTSTLFVIFGSVSFAVAVVLAYFVLSS